MCSFLILAFGEVQAADNLTIKNIEVSKSAANASAARSLAIATAQGKAYNQLLEANVLPEERKLLPVLNASQIGNLVAGFEVTDEKVGEKNYKAKFNITFERNKLRKLFADAGVKFLDNVSPNVLVLPILQQDSQVLLWEKENNWKEAWIAVAEKDKSVPLIVPLGDLDDITLVKVEDAFSGQFDALDKLAAKYDAGRILIAEGVLGQDKNGQLSLQVIMRLLQGEGILERLRADFENSTGATPQDFFELAAQQANKRLQETVKREASVVANENESEQTVLLQVPIKDIAKWKRFKQDIVKVQGVKQMQVETLASNLARVSITFKGDFSTFSYFLHNAGYTLTNNGDGTWWLNNK